MATTSSSPSYCQQYRQDYECSGYDPAEQQCDQDAQTVAAHSYHIDGGETAYAWNRWSSSCQSNWPEFGLSFYAQMTTIAMYYPYDGNNNTGDGRTEYTLSNTNYVYGQMLFGGKGTHCVDTVGNQGAFGDPTYFDEAGCV